jgi:hypothetical protein
MVGYPCNQFRCGRTTEPPSNSKMGVASTTPKDLKVARSPSFDLEVVLATLMINLGVAKPHLWLFKVV